ncbi:hypothetical protein PVT68_15680 [Microbulbifer bruguierae]|uniref:DNA-binding protein n=1 Tax=Microbulbifer bruguierae TaxID=3029061 RepID=A0ABY8NB90_9GAMM|nr:hypothetical protein [Microbulbifer bruguierae]WGL16200.1 hypothetical protein PVT68_15680 [Microbulbifer bruguierae]
MKKSPLPPAQGESDKTNTTVNIQPAKDPTKLERVLAYLATGRSLHRFEAEQEVNDHCLPSTMSKIKHDLGIPYLVRYETLSGWNGHPTRIARYWLEQGEHAQAWQRVFAMRKRRGVSP